MDLDLECGLLIPDVSLVPSIRVEEEEVYGLESEKSGMDKKKEDDVHSENLKSISIELKVVYTR